MKSLTCVSVGAMAGALALFPCVAVAQESVARCASMLQDAPALARKTGPFFKYPEAAYVNGKEGTVGYQYRLLDESGKVTVDCVYRSSGDAEIDLSVVQRVNATSYYPPKGFDLSRDSSRVYQDTSTLSWVSESRARAKANPNVARDRLIFEPPIPKPDFRYKFVQSTAQFVGHVAETGVVDMVSMRKSSGDYQLDAIAMESILRYRFKPGEPFTFDRPFNFKSID